MKMNSLFRFSLHTLYLVSEHCSLHIFQRLHAYRRQYGLQVQSVQSLNVIS